MLIKNIPVEGEELYIHTYPDPILKKKGKEVASFNDEIKKLCNDMLYTMYKAPGIGLAAPQIGKSLRIIVMDINYERELTTNAANEEEYVLSNTNPLVFINPEFVTQEGERIHQEGCLSLPGVYEDVKRFDRVRIRYQDVQGEPHELDADELLSICIQHEHDHLEGIVFIEKLSMLKRNFYRKKLMKEKQKYAQ